MCNIVAHVAQLDLTIAPSFSLIEPYDKLIQYVLI